MSKEIWKSINGTSYEVSSMGNVRNEKGPLNPIKTVYGYFEVGLYEAGKCERIKIHRAVAKAFVYNPDHKPQVNHLNGDKSDNRMENLQWVTHAENMKHAKEAKLVAAKEGHGMSKLTTAQVRYIRRYGKALGLSRMAKLFQVSHVHACRIARGEGWEGVK